MHRVWLDDTLVCLDCDWTHPYSGVLEEILEAAIGHSGDRDALADRMTLDPEIQGYTEALRDRLAA